MVKILKADINCILIQLRWMSRGGVYEINLALLVVLGAVFPELGVWVWGWLKAGFLPCYTLSSTLRSNFLVF